MDLGAWGTGMRGLFGSTHSEGYPNPSQRLPGDPQATMGSTGDVMDRAHHCCHIPFCVQQNSANTTSSSQSFPLPLPALLRPAAGLFHGLHLFSSSSHPMCVSSG